MFLHKLPEDLPYTTACLVEPTAVAFNGVRHTQVTPCDYVVIFGDGPIGLLTLLVTKTFGASQVVVVGATPNRLEKAAELGADAIVKALEADVEAVLRDLGHGSLPDAVIEATGNPAAAEQAIEVVGDGGRVTLLGLFAGQKATLNLDRLVVGDITLRGRLGSPGIWPDVIRLIQDGRINPSSIISHQLALQDFLAGIDMVRTRSDGVVKIVVTQVS